MQTVRERLEAQERDFLAPHATLSSASRGRKEPVEPCPLRTEFQRDRDRIIHSKAFRRLKHKTQVFIAPEGDHYRTRLTHTLEVAQIARTIAKGLRLNEDLTEAIALGHDLGHTPFGHCGEHTLSRLLKETPLGGFIHGHQSLRVVEHLEGGKGLNLTWEVRDGIRNHSHDSQIPPSTLEGRVVSFADKIAYINHDVDDALRAGILRQEDLPQDCLEVLGYGHSQRIGTMVGDIIRNSYDKPIVAMSPPIKEATEKLYRFLLDRVYVGSRAKVEEAKAERLVRILFEYFTEHPDLAPVVHPDDSELWRVVDYIAGMTDRYAIAVFQRLFVPEPWNLNEEGF
ncbi:MAG: deoxyguanosinetriphosphate triphosphohydrolase [Bacillota bacterium]